MRRERRPQSRWRPLPPRGLVHPRSVDGRMEAVRGQERDESVVHGPDGDLCRPVASRIPGVLMVRKETVRGMTLPRRTCCAAG